MTPVKKQTKASKAVETKIETGDIVGIEVSESAVTSVEESVPKPSIGEKIAPYVKKFQGNLEVLGVSKVLLLGLMLGLLVGGAFAFAFTLRPTSTNQQSLDISQTSVLPSVTVAPEGKLLLSESCESKSSLIAVPSDELSKIAEDYITKNMVVPGTSVAVNKVTEEDNGLYKLEIALSYQGQIQNVESYATLDGKVFFPSAIDISTAGSLESPHGTTAPGETPAPTQAPAQTHVANSEGLVDDDPSVGPADAPVTIVEFSDFQCPFCARSAIVVHEILDTYGDQVRFVYRDYPITSIHPFAQKAAEAGECADDQGKFWELHDIIFTNQDRISVDHLKGYAKDLGMDTDVFNACLDSGKYETEVLKDLMDGQNAGVSSTPTFFVNGEMIVGAKPFSVFQAVIDSKLNPGSGIVSPTSSGTGSGTASVLPAFATSNEVVRKAYMVSTEIPEVLEKIPCYCSCGSVGHDSLKECYISEDGSFSEHASVCDICILEALDVDQWYRDGVSVQEIRTRIDEKYSQYGEPTNTPM